VFILRLSSSNILIASLVLEGWIRLMIQLWNKLALTWEVGTRCPLHIVDLMDVVGSCNFQ
jgi:hypothetical protein